MFTIRGHFHNLPRQMMTMMMIVMLLVMMMMAMMMIGMLLVMMMMAVMKADDHNCNQGDSLLMTLNASLLCALYRIITFLKSNCITLY